MKNNQNDIIKEIAGIFQNTDLDERDLKEILDLSGIPEITTQVISTIKNIIPTAIDLSSLSLKDLFKELKKSDYAEIYAEAIAKHPKIRINELWEGLILSSKHSKIQIIFAEAIAKHPNATIVMFADLHRISNYKVKTIFAEAMDKKAEEMKKNFETLPDNDTELMLDVLDKYFSYSLVNSKAEKCIAEIIISYPKRTVSRLKKILFRKGQDPLFGSEGKRIIARQIYILKITEKIKKLIESN